jgi:hypothetical protein
MVEVDLIYSRRSIYSLSAEELIDLFQRPLYNIQRAWRAPLFRIVQRCHRASFKGPPKMKSAAPLLSLSFPAYSLNVIIGSGSRWLGSCRIWRSASSESALMRSLSPYFCGKRGRLFRRSKHIENEPKRHTGLLGHWIIPDLSPFDAISNALFVNAVLARPTGS